MNRFGMVTFKIMLSPDKVANIVLATILLHNMLREQSKEFYTTEGFADGEDDDIETIKVVGEMTELAILLLLKLCLCNFFLYFIT